jgi:hypothetical protein
MKRGIVIDSLSREIGEFENTMHTRNAIILARELGYDLYGSENLPDVKYEKVVFVHSSPATKISENLAFMERNKDSDCFYIKNEYNLGEPVLFWAMHRDFGTKLTTIANHEQKPPFGTRFDKYQDEEHCWHIVNLNCLIYDEIPVYLEDESFSLFAPPKIPIVYYGAVRKDRAKYFEKYFKSFMTVSTAYKNQGWFKGISTEPTYIDKLNWFGTENTLKSFDSILYIEDELTHENYNFLANRFYESLSCGVPCFFDSSCIGTIEKAGYPINRFYIVDSAEELEQKLNCSDWMDYGWRNLCQMASGEKRKTLLYIERIINRARLI